MYVYACFSPSICTYVHACIHACMYVWWFPRTPSHQTMLTDFLVLRILDNSVVYFLYLPCYQALYSVYCFINCVFVCLLGLTFTWWGRYGLCLWRKPAEFAYSFSFCSCVYFCLYSPFNCISFHKFSWQLSVFSLCSSGLISASVALSTVCLFMKISFSPYP